MTFVTGGSIKMRNEKSLLESEQSSSGEMKNVNEK
jgi:hypothetical protein